MKQIQVRKVPYGETFSVFGDKFVALDYISGNVLAIRKEIWKNAPFDTGGVNDLRTASITGHLVQYFEDLCKNGASEDTVPMNVMDLKATDGSREYGTFGMRAGLLTLEQYGKYQDIIPLADDWWCLATPWRTPNPGGLRSPYTNYTHFRVGRLHQWRLPRAAMPPSPMASAPLCTLPLTSWSLLRMKERKTLPTEKRPFTRITGNTSKTGLTGTPTRENRP